MKKFLELLFAYFICLLIALTLVFRAESVDKSYEAKEQVNNTYALK